MTVDGYDGTGFCSPKLVLFHSLFQFQIVSSLYYFNELVFLDTFQRMEKCLLR
jgi:hypothetical protein